MYTCTCIIIVATFGLADAESITIRSPTRSPSVAMVTSSVMGDCVREEPDMLPVEV